MLASDPLALLRQTLGDTNPAGRWLDSTLLSFIDRGNKRVVRDLGFPDTRLTTPSVAGVQEYQLPTIILPKRCYLAGQLCVPTTIDTLEGHQIRLYDQTATTNAAYAPQWSVQSPLSYPVGNSWGWVAPDAQPWFGGQRPRFYLRGGYLGVVPAPANVVTITFDCVMLPATIVSATMTLTTPDTFMDAIVYAAAVYAMQATEGKMGESREYEEWYQKRMREQRTTLKSYYEVDAPGGPKPLTSRSRYGWSQKKRHSGWA